MIVGLLLKLAILGIGYRRSYTLAQIVCMLVAHYGMFRLLQLSWNVRGVRLVHILLMDNQFHLQPSMLVRNNSRVCVCVWYALSAPLHTSIFEHIQCMSTWFVRPSGVWWMCNRYVQTERYIPHLCQGSVSAVVGLVFGFYFIGSVFDTDFVGYRDIGLWVLGLISTYLEEFVAHNNFIWAVIQRPCKLLRRRLALQFFDDVDNI